MPINFMPPDCVHFERYNCTLKKPLLGLFKRSCHCVGGGYCEVLKRHVEKRMLIPPPPPPPLPPTKPFQIEVINKSGRELKQGEVVMKSDVELINDKLDKIIELIIKKHEVHFIGPR